MMFMTMLYIHILMYTNKTNTKVTSNIKSIITLES